MLRPKPNPALLKLWKVYPERWVTVSGGGLVDAENTRDSGEGSIWSIS